MNEDIKINIAKLVCLGINNESAISFEASDMEKIYQELKEQTVLGLTSPLLKQMKEKIPEDTYIKWKQDILSQVMKYDWYMNEQDKILKELAKEQIPCVILKGSAAGKYYPYPELRSMGDIDLLVQPEMLEQAQKVIENCGYSDSGNENPKHIHYKKGKIDVELHRSFSDKTGEGQGILDSVLFRQFSSIEMTSVSGYSVPTLPAIENGIVLLKHIYQHIRTGLGMRQIIDWKQYVECKLDDTLWNEGFQEAAKSIHLDKLAVMVTRMCQLYFGLSEKNRNWCMQNTDLEVCEELFSYIMASGNFGRKYEKNNIRGAARILDSGTINTFTRLQKSGEVHWKLLEKAPFLKPFAWMYQIFYWLAHHRKKEKGILENVIDGAREVNKLQAFWKKIGIDNFV